VVHELNGENMDIIEWDEDPIVYITNALKPADVLEVHFIGDNNNCIVVVPDDQLSLAIGKKGQNVRLAARLTGYKIDIKSETDFEEVDIEALQAKAEEEAREKEEELDVAEVAKEDIQEEEDTVLVDERELGEEFYVEDEEVVTDDIDELESSDNQPDIKDDPTESVLETEYEEGALSSEQTQEMIDLAEDRHQEAQEENRMKQKEEILEDREDADEDDGNQ
jgi:N utilization substance protein A